MFLSAACPNTRGAGNNHSGNQATCIHQSILINLFSVSDSRITYFALIRQRQINKTD
ncbi:hypothetical protein VIN01S_14110 [Vibrio inusitatus NBRC 102082]|uniref:Uncharacterized protein n=1 Tax=Vibrio inusitatus NBRC 102082 TaxID=1219070 RepID=A0A4Y3HU77_9VIBR|nr:hypothetical protein VIN01S_14110 [Vibrio inusitatus NBRC 102082]